MTIMSAWKNTGLLNMLLEMWNKITITVLVVLNCLLHVCHWCTVYGRVSAYFTATNWYRRPLGVVHFPLWVLRTNSNIHVYSSVCGPTSEDGRVDNIYHSELDFVFFIFVHMPVCEQLLSSSVPVQILHEIQRKCVDVRVWRSDI